MDKLPDPKDQEVKVLHEWEFTKQNESMPIYFDDVIRVDTDVWVEMMNPNEQDAVVNATIYGIFRTKNR